MCHCSVGSERKHAPESHHLRQAGGRRLCVQIWQAMGRLYEGYAKRVRRAESMTFKTVDSSAVLIFLLAPLDFLGQNSYYLSRGYYSLSFVFDLRQARSLLWSQNIFSVTKEEFKNQHSRTESTLSNGFTDRQPMWHNKLDTVSGACQDL